jgi:tol-pal system protein YbgF
MKAELRSLRERNGYLQRRLEQLEGKESASAPSNNNPSESGEVPALTVIKLKPRADAVPRLNLSVPVREPSPETMRDWIAGDLEVNPGGDDRPSSAGDWRYEEGVAALKTGNVSGGVERLRRFAADNPRHPKAGEALYFSGVGLMGLSDYREAAQVFEQILATYPAGNTVVDAMLRLAECRVRLNHLSDAQSLYRQVASKYPGTAAAKQAEQRLVSLTP